MNEAAKKGSGIVFFLVGFVNLVIMIPFMGPASVLSTLMADLNIPIAMTAYIVSIYLIMCGVFLFAGSMIGNKFGYKNTWWFGLLAIAIGLAISAIATNFTVYFIGRIISGIGFGITMSAQFPLAGMWFQGSRFTALQTVITALSSVGVAAAFIVFPLFSSWRTATWVFAGITLLYALASLIWVKHPPEYTEAMEAGKNNGSSQSKPKFGFVFRNKDFMLILLINTVVNSANTILLTFMSSYFLQEAGMSQTLATTIASLLTFIQIAGAIVGGILTGKTGRRKIYMVIGVALYGAFGVGLVLFGNLIGLIIVSAIICGAAFYFRMPVMAQYFLEETEVPDPDVMAAAAAVTTGIPMLLNLVASAIAGGMVATMGFGSTILIWHLASLAMVIPALILNEVGPKSKRATVADVEVMNA